MSGNIFPFPVFRHYKIGVCQLLEFSSYSRIQCYLHFCNFVNLIELLLSIRLIAFINGFSLALIAGSAKSTTPTMHRLIVKTCKTM